MGIKLARLWAWAAVILPAGFGALLLLNPSAATEMNTATELAQLVGIRQVVYSGVLLVAILSLPLRSVALLVAGRGITDLADALVALIGRGTLEGPTLFPLVTSVISFAAAYLMYTAASGTSKDSSKGMYA